MLHMIVKAMNFISRRILNEMRKKEWKQFDLAHRAGISQSILNRILNTANNARIGTLNKIAKALAVPVQYLITEDETKALLYMEISKMDQADVHATLLHLDKEKLYKQAKKAS